MPRRVAEAWRKLLGEPRELEAWLVLESLRAPRSAPPGIPFRVRIGVTGHRMLRDPESVARRVEEALRWIENAVLSSSAATPVVYTVFSALAEGADRLVAKAVLEREAAGLQVVLPLEPHDFIKDFQTGASRAEFAALLERAREPPYVPPHEEERPEAYAAGGRTLVDRIDLLIAVWDHEPPRGVGGTATVVDYARRKNVPTLVLSVVDPDRIHFPPLPKRPGLVYRTLDRLDLWLGERREVPRLAVLRDAYQRLDAFNRERLPQRRVESGCERERADSAPAARDVGIDDSFAEWVLPIFVRADVLASLYQWKYTRLALVVFLAAAAAVSIAALVEIILHVERLLWAEVGLMVVVFALVLYTRRRRPHDRWISYRSLAENLRSAPFFALLSARGADRELDSDPFAPWFQRAFTEIWSRRPAEPSVPDDARLLARFLDDAWIGGQIAYHAKASSHFNQRHRLVTGLIYLTFLTTLFSVLFDLVLEPKTDILVFLAISLPALGAALSGYRELRQYGLHAERYHRAKNRLEDIRVGMLAEDTAEEVKGRAVSAYAVMLEENLDWFGVLEFTDLEIVI